MGDLWAALDRRNQRTAEWQNERQARRDGNLGSSLKRTFKWYLGGAVIVNVLELLLEDALGGWLWGTLLLGGAIVCFSAAFALDRRERRAWERCQDANGSPPNV